MLVEGDSPLVGICVPTYNRAALLDGLLGNLYAVQQRLGPRVQICISNNASTDETAEVLKRHAVRLTMRAVAQSTNLGSSRNVFAVAGLSSAKWLLFAGDDDLVDVDALEWLITCGALTDERYWVLACDQSGRKERLGRRPGTQRAMGGLTSKAWLLCRGATPFAFFGANIIPACVFRRYVQMDLKAYEGWPHIAILLRFLLAGGRIRIVNRVPVRQAAGGIANFWRAGDYVYLHTRLREIMMAPKTKGADTIYKMLAVGRMVYDISHLGAFVSLRMRAKRDFQKQSLSALHPRGDSPHPGLKILMFPLTLFRLMLSAIPLSVLHRVVPSKYRSKILELERRSQELPESYDGIKRGI